MAARARLMARAVPLVVLQLGGLAREIAREVPAATLAAGMTLDIGDGRGNVHQSGLALLLHGLAKKFAPLEVELSSLLIR